MSTKKIPNISQNIEMIISDLRVLRESQSEDIDKIDYLISLIVNYLEKHNYICRYDMSFNDSCYFVTPGGGFHFMKSKCLCCCEFISSYNECGHKSTCSFIKKN